MRARWLYWRPALVPLIAAALVACATSEQVPTESSLAVSRRVIKEVLAVGYANIMEKYLVPVRGTALASDGLRGLGTLAPGIEVTRSGDKIVLVHSGRVVASQVPPPEEDAEGWATLTTDFLMAARKGSSELRSASDEKVFEAMFDGMLAHLDSYSRYSGSDEAYKNRSKRDGFGGVGISFDTADGRIIVSEVMPETPAERAGIQKGDRITHVGSVPITGMKAAEISQQLRGPILSKVALTVLRGNSPEPLTIEVERALIVPPTVVDRQQDGIVVLEISGFNQDTPRSITSKIFTHQRQLGTAMKGIVLDLRGNPGGLLKQSVKVADLFLKRGPILTSAGRHPDSVQVYEASGSDIAEDLPIVVLIDGRSASAAEIVAAALQDRERAVVVGTSSFGKGTVQTVVRLPNEGEITLTWSKLLAPSGYPLHGLGVHPTICTSGVPTSRREFIDQALNDRPKATAILAAWRKLGADDVARQKELRATCPPERRDQKVDLEIARELLSDPAFYARALGLTGTTNVARH